MDGKNIRSTAKTRKVHLPMLLQTLRASRKKTRPYLPHQSKQMALENEDLMLRNIEEIAFMCPTSARGLMHALCLHDLACECKDMHQVARE